MARTGVSTALLTDMYELTMLNAWVKDGRQDDPAVFEVFARRLSPGHRYGVVAGIHRVVEAVQNFTFMPEGEGTKLLAWLQETAGLSDDTCEYLANYKFQDSLLVYPEGELYFPGSPVVQVHGRLADVVLETMILSIMNHDCAIASKAARMVAEAHGSPIIEMGSRRTHEEAAVAAARAAYLVGFEATSNLQAGLQYGVPVRGTAAHAFTLSYKAYRPEGIFKPGEIDSVSDTEAELFAFHAQVAALGHETTLLVDTFGTEQGIRNAVKAAGTSLGAIRLDSGDLALEAAKARKLLDSLGAYGTRIIVTSDLDEHVIKDLRIAGAPIDGYGVGTKLVSAEPAGMVYKLVQVNGAPVAKKAKDKLSVGGAKTATRHYDGDHKITEERLYLDTPTPGHGGHIFQQVVMAKGKPVPGWLDLEAARAYHQKVVDGLPVNERAVWHGDHGPFLTAEVVA